MHLNTFKDSLNTYWRNIDKKIFISFVLLFLLGIFFSFSSTSSLAGERLNKNYYFFFSKHLFFVLFALVVMFFVSFIRLNILKKFILPIFIILFISLMLVPLIGIEVKGSKRWLNFYFFNLQPVELIKPFFVLLTAKILTYGEFKTSNSTYLLSFFILVSIVILLVNQPDLGQSILLIGTWISIVFISGISLFYIFSFFGVTFSCLIGLIILIPEKFGL